jgi:hypothetical protein
VSLPGMQSLANFYDSVHFMNPRLAETIGPDVMRVQMDSLSAEPSDIGKNAADNLRRVAFDLPVIQAKVLENALEELGY